MILVNNRDKIEWRDNMTVQDLLNTLRYEYALITVTVNEELVASEDYGRFQLRDGDQVGVFHLAHGG